MIEAHVSSVTVGHPENYITFSTYNTMLLKNTSFSPKSKWSFLSVSSLKLGKILAQVVYLRDDSNKIPIAE